MKMNKIFLLLVALFLQAYIGMCSVNAADAADKDRGTNVTDNADSESMIYLRSPKSRLARLDGFLDLTKSQKTRILRILHNEDSSIRAVVKKGDNDIRKILNEEQQEQFDELKPDTEVAPDVQRRPTARLKPVQGMGGERGQRQGRQMRGQRSGSKMGSGGQGIGGGQREYCGDGTCQEIERTHGVCSQDCDEE